MAIFAKEAYRSDVSVTTLLALRFALAARSVLGDRRHAAPGSRPSRTPTRRVVLVGLALGAHRLRRAVRRLLRRAHAHRRLADRAAALHLPRAGLRRSRSRSAASAPTAAASARSRWRPRAPHSSWPAAARARSIRSASRWPSAPPSLYVGLHPGRRPLVGRIDPFLLGALITTGAAIDPLRSPAPSTGVPAPGASPPPAGRGSPRSGWSRRSWPISAFMIGLRRRRAGDRRHRLDLRAGRHRRARHGRCSASASARCRSRAERSCSPRC